MGIDSQNSPTTDNESGFVTAMEGTEAVNTEKRRIAGVFETSHSDFIKINNNPDKSKSETDFILKQTLTGDFGTASRYLKSIQEKAGDNITWQDFKDKVTSIADKLSDGAKEGKFEPDSDLDKLRMSMGEIATSLNRLPKASLILK